MSEFYSVVTNIGRAKIASAIANSETLGLKAIAVGDGNGNPIIPDVTMTALVREVYRGDLNELRIDPMNPNYMIAEIVIPTLEGGWTVREVGLFDTSGNLIAVSNYPESYKPIVSEGSGRDMVIRLILKVEDGETAALELKIDPSVVLASREWVEINFALQYTLPGGLTGQILRKASNTDGDVEWYDPLSGLNVLVEAVEETQSLAASQTVIVLAIASTASTAFYVDGVRLYPSQYTIDSATQITLAMAATGGESFLAVQNEPAAGLTFLQKTNNLADLPNKAVSRNNLGVKTESELLEVVLNALYPIGEILTTNRDGAPNTWSGAWAGFGSWERFAQGRTLVGFDSTDSDFSVLGKQGGEKNHLLTEPEMPSHRHLIVKNVGVSSGNNLNANSSLGQSAGGDRDYSLGYTTEEPDVGRSGLAGGDDPHNNLQPYRVVFYWKRIA